MEITKLDGRHAGSQQWKYYAEIESRALASIEVRRRMFHDWRVWCWDTWGPSKELTDYDHQDLYDDVRCSNAHWCWLNDEFDRRRIYLRTDADAEIFSLRWS